MVLRISHHAVGIASGSLLMFSAFDEGGPMWTGEGPRAERRPVRFDQPFLAPPRVMVGLSMWDIAGGSNQRADITAENVTREGFDLVFRVWGDTRVARVRAEWLAIGPTEHEGDWEV